MSPNRLKRAVRAAKWAAAQASGPARVGCVLVEGGQIVSTGWSSMRTHPLQASHSKNQWAIHLHAEVDCLADAIDDVLFNNALRNRMRKRTLVVVRIKRDGSLALARPCGGCMSLIVKCGVGELYFSTQEGAICQQKLL